MYMKERGSSQGLLFRTGIVVALWLLSLYFVSNTSRKYVNEQVAQVQEKLAYSESQSLGYVKMAEEKLAMIQGQIQHLEEETNRLSKIPLPEPPNPNTAIVQPEPDTKFDKLALTQTLFTMDRQIFGLWGQVRSRMPERIHYRRAKGVIVTAANEGYYPPLENLIGSVHFWDPSRNIVVFDLGLSEPSLQKLKRYDRVRVYQSPIKSELKNYAWKAYCIRFATEKYGKTIWLDAGSDLRGDPKKIDQLLEDEDAFFVQGQDEDMSPWSHPQTLDFFKTNKDQMRGKYSFSGNLQGYVYDSQAFWDVLMVVERCCQLPECIAPAGSSLANHRYDQIAMSASIYTNPKITITPHTELLAAVRAQLDPDHTKESSHIVWSARGGTHEYNRYLKMTGKVFDAPEVSEILLAAEKKATV